MILSSRAKQTNLTAAQLLLIQDISLQFAALCSESQQLVNIAIQPHLQVVSLPQLNGTINIQTVLAANSTTSTATAVVALLNSIAPLLQSLLPKE